MPMINPELNPEQWMFAFTEMMKSLPLDDIAKGKLEMLSNMTMSKVQMKYVADMATLAATAKQGELTSVQAEQMLRQITAQMQQVPQGGVEPPPEQITGPEEQITPVAPPQPGQEQMVSQGNATPDMGM